MNTRSLKYISLVFSCISMVVVSELVASEDGVETTTPEAKTELSDPGTVEQETQLNNDQKSEESVSDEHQSTKTAAQPEEPTSETGGQKTQLSDDEKSGESEPAEASSSLINDKLPSAYGEGNAENIQNEESDKEQINNAIDSKLEGLIEAQNNLEIATKNLVQIVASCKNNNYVQAIDGESGGITTFIGPKTEKIDDTAYGYRGDQILRKLRYSIR